MHEGQANGNGRPEPIQAAPVREHRLLLTTAAEDQSRSIIEGALERRTIAHVSGFDINREVAMEIFTLEPERTDRHDATTLA